MADAAPIDETELTTQLSTCGLVRAVADSKYRLLHENSSVFVETLAVILNAADAPPIDLHIEESLSELKGTHFFPVQHVLCDLIPFLNVDTDLLLTFVSRLIEAGGNDMVAGGPSTAFGEWTKKDSTRPPQVYEAARTGNTSAISQLYTVLRMNGDIEESLSFARADKPETKLAAIAALGAMELGERYSEVLDTLLQGASSGEEATALQSLEAGYRAAAQRVALAPAGLDEQLERVLKTRSPLAIHLAADLLWLHRKGLSAAATDLCLTAVADVAPENVGTIGRIDHVAYQLVGAGDVERAVTLLAQIMDRTKGRVTLDSFQSTYHALQNAGSDVLGAAVVYWLLNGENYTCRCVSQEVCCVGNDTTSFSIPTSSIPSSPSDQLFLCRKAVGWFFIDPMTAVAIPLAVLRDGSPDIANEVLGLIYDPLLLSYGSTLKERLEQYVADGNTNCSCIKELLARKTELQDAMEGIERLVELHPTETQREAERFRWNETMERSMALGRKKSILSDLFTNQYILYGRSSLTPIYAADGATHLTEIEMKPLSISSELPLLDIVDPIGLNHTLLQFKLETRE